MMIKSLNELNREFQMEMMTGSSRNSMPDLTAIKLTQTNETEQIDNIRVKSIDELNREFQSEVTTGEFEKLPFMKSAISKKSGTLRKQKKTNKGKRKKRSIFSLISDMLFYLAICIVLISVLASAPDGGGGKARMIMGYSYFTVLTPSMQDEIPKGSLILVKQTDPNTLNIGDNITFMKDADTSVTHKISDIYENYDNSGARGFQTKGVNNANPDRDIVYESNIVGKVILVLPAAGAAIYYLRANIYIVFVIFGLLVLLSFLLRVLFGKSPKAGRLPGLPDFSKTNKINDIDNIDIIEGVEIE